MTGFIKSLTYTLFLTLLLTFQSCNKELAPADFSGTWEIDTSASFVRVMYNQDLVSQYPNVLDFLVRKKYDLKEKILVPDRIEFISPNVVKFYYSSDIQRVVNGSYTQSDSYVTIVNDNFPFGISAATNNIKLEIYYPTNYILNQLYSLLTVQDDPQEYFSYVIVNADGVGVYTKSSSGK